MRKFSKEEKIGVVGTVLVHVVLGVVLWFLVLNSATPANDPVKPEEEPEILLEVEFEVEEVVPSSGGATQAKKPEEDESKEDTNGEVKNEETSPKQENLQQTDDPGPTRVTDEVAGDESEKDEVSEISEKPIEFLKKKPEEIKNEVKQKWDDIKKKVEEEKQKKEKKINDNILAALNNPGKPIIEPVNPKPDNSVNPSIDIGKGISFDLEGREVVGGLVKPEYTEQDDPVIYIDIIVNSVGDVVSAEVRPGTISANKTLRENARKAALKTKFNKVDSKENQHGTITYNYELIK